MGKVLNFKDVRKCVICEKNTLKYRKDLFVEKDGTFVCSSCDQALVAHCANLKDKLLKE